jgi:hypothetical protein
MNTDTENINHEKHQIHETEKKLKSKTRVQRCRVWLQIVPRPDLPKDFDFEIVPESSQGR